MQAIAYLCLMVSPPLHGGGWGDSWILRICANTGERCTYFKESCSLESLMWCRIKSDYSLLFVTANSSENGFCFLLVHAKVIRIGFLWKKSSSFQLNGLRTTVRSGGLSGDSRRSPTRFQFHHREFTGM